MVEHCILAHSVDFQYSILENNIDLINQAVPVDILTVSSNSDTTLCPQTVYAEATCMLQTFVFLFQLYI